MKEVEIKFQLEDLDKARAFLEKQGHLFGEEVSQKDVYFTDAKTAKSFDVFAPGKNFVRIRTQNGKFILNLKCPQTGEMDCIENETVVSDPLETEEILKKLGLVKVTEVTKRRIESNRNGITVCLDNVEGLGFFIELEKIIDNESNSLAVQDSLRGYLNECGVEVLEEVTHGYDTLKYIAEK